MPDQSSVSTITTLLLSPEHRQSIERHAEATYPDECCGIMLGSQENGGRAVKKLIEIENEWDEQERRRRFLITPKHFLQAEREARSLKMDVLGFYHSHPDAPARPSEFDREHAWPWYAYPIVSVRDGKTVEINGWQLRDDRSGYEKVEIREWDRSV